MTFQLLDPADDQHEPVSTHPYARSPGTGPRGESCGTCRRAKLVNPDRVRTMSPHDRYICELVGLKACLSDDGCRILEDWLDESMAACCLWQPLPPPPPPPRLK